MMNNNTSTARRSKSKSTEDMNVGEFRMQIRKNVIIYIDIIHKHFFLMVSLQYIYIYI